MTVGDAYAGRVIAEADTVQKTAFWKEFSVLLAERYRFAVDHCVMDNGDVSRFQGRARAFNEVLGLPDEIIKVYKAKKEGHSE